MQGTWILQKVNGNTDVPKHPEVKIEEERLSYGYGNRYFGGCKVDGENVTIGPLAGTLMMVMPPLVPDEYVVSQAFSESVKFRVQGNNLLLLNSAGQIVVQLSK